MGNRFRAHWCHQIRVQTVDMGATSDGTRGRNIRRRPIDRQEDATARGANYPRHHQQCNCLDKRIQPTTLSGSHTLDKDGTGTPRSKSQGAKMQLEKKLSRSPGRHTRRAQTTHHHATTGSAPSTSWEGPGKDLARTCCGLQRRMQQLLDRKTLLPPRAETLKAVIQPTPMTKAHPTARVKLTAGHGGGLT